MAYRYREYIAGIFCSICAVLFLGSLISYQSDDISLFSSSASFQVHNWIGIVGAYSSAGLYFLFGYAAYCVPLFLLFWALEHFFGVFVHKRLWLRMISSLICVGTCATLCTFFYGEAYTVAKFYAGGFIGTFFGNLLYVYLGLVGSLVIALTCIVLSFILSTDFLIIKYIFHFFQKIIQGLGAFIQQLQFASKKSQKTFPKQKKNEKQEEKIIIKASQEAQKENKVVKEKVSPVGANVEAKSPGLQALDEKSKTETASKEVKPKITLNTEFLKQKKPEKEIISKPTNMFPLKDKGKYTYPTSDLLNAPIPVKEEDIREELENSSRILEETLRDFDIEAKVMQVHQGPTITTYELEPAPGVKVNKIVSLSDDIALALKAYSIRIIAPIPGKSRVGIEVPNSQVTRVFLRDIFETTFYSEIKEKYQLPMILGKDVSGVPLVADLTEMPHLLIAGATGAGKTVCVNSIIMSLLCKMHPDMLKFIMIDPKMVEMTAYNNLPHLICPVITDAKKAAKALSWIVNEMEQRYKLLAKAGVRNISSYNDKIKRREPSKESTQGQEEDVEIMPYMVILIDELADLMLIAKDVVETAIMRLAQLSRAVGIHLVLATQRPSVDVITGVIKANFPARISFRVASKVDSRTVLDTNGADKLLGKGDMLFLKPGAAKPMRGQGAYLADDEIEKVVDFIKKQREPQYIDEILDDTNDNPFAGVSQEEDDLFKDACKLVLDTGQASASLLQRRFRIGYTRAARLIDMMEEKKIVGPYRGSKPREILVSQIEDATDV